jgi:hypothetical protein
MSQGSKNNTNWEGEGGEGGGRVCGKGGGGGRGEKWPEPCMHIWIIKLKKIHKKDTDFCWFFFFWDWDNNNNNNKNNTKNQWNKKLVHSKIKQDWQTPGKSD